MHTIERVARATTTVRRRCAVLVVAGLVATLLAASPAGAAAADEQPWHLQGRVLAGPTTGPELPGGPPQDIRALTGPDDLAVATRRGLWRLRLSQTGGARTHQLETLALAGEAGGGAAADWQARLHRDGRVVAVVCPDEPAGSCTLRVRGTTGTWTTLAGGGRRWLEPSADPSLTSWAHLPQLPGTADYAGVDPLDLGLVLPTQMLLDETGDRVLLHQRGFVSSLWSVDLTTGAVARVARPDHGATPRVPGVEGPLSDLALLPDGRLLVSPDVHGLDQLVVDLDTDLTATTGVPAGRVAVAADGTVWVRQSGIVSRMRLDGDVVEHFLGDDLHRLGLWLSPDFVMLDHPDGLLTFGQEQRYAYECCHAPVVAGAVRAVLLRSGPTVADAPADVSAVAGDGRATVTWAASYGYGRPVSGYTVTASPGGRSVTVAGTARSATVTGLANATAHRFTVVATNEVGRGPASAASAPVTPRDAVPPGPVTMGATSVTTGAVRLTWTMPGDADLAGVTVVRRTGRVAPTHPTDGTVVYRGGATQYRATGLAPGTGYAFSVFARDTAGNHSARAAVATPGAVLSHRTTGADGAPRSVIAYGTREALIHTVTLRDTSDDPVHGRSVALQIRPRGTSTWTTLGSRTTSRGVAYFTHRPAWNAEYRVVFAGAGTVTGGASAVSRLDVRPVVSSSLSASDGRRGTKVALSGTVTPAHRGSVVQLFRKTSTGWTKAAEQKLSSTSTYRFTVSRSTAGSTTYRVVIPTHADHVSGTSAHRTVRWR